VTAVWTGVVVCSIVAVFYLAACRAPAPDPDSPAAFAAARTALLEELRADGIGDVRVLGAIAKVPRHEFVLPQDRDRAYANHALPIPGGQTISQPYIVALMTQLLELRGDERVLEVGTGSGYQAAVLAELAREVYSIELDPGLAESARQRLARLGYGRVQVRAGDGYFGWEEAAPFDAIIITATAPRIPERLVAQLKPGAPLVMPLSEGFSETLIRARQVDGDLKIERIADVAFVPMRGAIRGGGDREDR